jgi:hypothetical protein
MAVALNKRSTAEPNAGSGTQGGVEGSATFRLRVLDSLPRPYQDQFIEIIRERCKDYIAAASRSDWRIGEWEADELSSEVFAKMLGVSGIGMVHDPAVDSGKEVPAIPDNWTYCERVTWLVDQVGGPQALKHRHEDIRRRRHGGKWRGGGYRQVQLKTAHVEGLSVKPDDPHREEDARKAWRGLLAMAASEFKPAADALLLLGLMARDPEVQAGFGAEWPVSKLVSALNLKHPIPPWNDDRVENAKKRLKNWIVRLKRIHGLSTDDLEDLFARRGRKER